MFRTGPKRTWYVQVVLTFFDFEIQEALTSLLK